MLHGCYLGAGVTKVGGKTGSETWCQARRGLIELFLAVLRAGRTSDRFTYPRVIPRFRPQYALPTNVTPARYLASHGEKMQHETQLEIIDNHRFHCYHGPRWRPDTPARQERSLTAGRAMWQGKARLDRRPPKIPVTLGFLNL